MTKNTTATSRTSVTTALVVKAQQAWLRLRHDERGEGLVSFLIIAVAVAAIALFVIGVFEDEAVRKVGELDLG